MRRFRISDQIEYLRPDHEIGRFLCSGMIVRGSGTLFFDTNFGKAATRELLACEKPDFALISHYHLDHSFWGMHVQGVSDAQLYVPRGEEGYAADPEFFFRKTLGPTGSGEQWRRFVLKTLKWKGLPEFGSYDGSFSLDLKKTRVVFIPAPGHSPGHMTAWFPQEKILFTSDLGFGPFGPWYGFCDCDVGRYVNSLLCLKGLRPRLLLTSHDGIISEGIDERFDRTVSVFSEREGMIRRGLEKGWTRDSIVETGIYFQRKEKAKGSLRGFLFDWDRIMFDHHMRVLEEGGLRSLFPGSCP